MKTLQILMSTYNGAEYIREQLDSLLEQDCEKYAKASFQIQIRDDGSVDGTQDILEEYAVRYPGKLRWYQGENVGVIRTDGATPLERVTELAPKVLEELRGAMREMKQGAVQEPTAE